MRLAGFNSIISAITRDATISPGKGGLARIRAASVLVRRGRATRMKPDADLPWIVCCRWGEGTFGQFIMQITWLYMYTFESFGSVMFMLWFFDSQRGLAPPPAPSPPPCPLKGGGRWGGGDNFFFGMGEGYYMIIQVHIWSSGCNIYLCCDFLILRGGAIPP